MRDKIGQRVKIFDVYDKCKGNYVVLSDIGDVEDEEANYSFKLEGIFDIKSEKEMWKLIDELGKQGVWAEWQYIQTDEEMLEERNYAKFHFAMLGL